MNPIDRPTVRCLLGLVLLLGAPSPANAVDLRDSLKVLLQDNCFDCHGDGADEGNLQLDELLKVTDNAATRDAWWKVLKNLRAGTMPPPDSGYSLTDSELRQLTDWIKYSAMDIDPEQPDPGKVTLRRLNRREYRRTIRDLMGIDFNSDIVFPPDDTGFGFDNIGDVLSVSPMMLEKYLFAAQKIIQQAVPRVTRLMPEMEFSGKEIRTARGRPAQNLPLAKSAKVEMSFALSATAEYRIVVLLEEDGTFTFSPERALVSINLDGEELHQGEYGWDADKKVPLEFVRRLNDGKHTLQISVTPTDPLQAGDSDYQLTDSDEEAAAKISVDAISILGPTEKALWQNPPGYDRFFHRTDPPSDFDARRAYAREVLERFAQKAFRRPPEKQTVDRLVEIAEATYLQAGKTFEEGVATAMVPVLASPRFLMRVEKPEDGEAGPFPAIDQYSLASRLSYFLWSTMPDEELFELASRGELRQQLRPQLLRMMQDERSSAFVESFGGQWLRISDIEKVTVDPLSAFGLRAKYEAMREEYGELRDVKSPTAEQKARIAELRSEFGELRQYRDLLDNETRTAFRRETEMLIERIFRENRSLTDIVDPGYTFLNERLAELYDIDGVEGDEMRLVELPEGSQRGGILTHGTMLTVTSNPTRTSPVKRGLFILENLLGTPTPPAPGDVPELESSLSRFGEREPSLREVLAVHRESPLCASCHARFDPLGLALENFNALGLWRDTDGDAAIDASGELITGESFANVQQLRKLLVTHRRQDLYRCVTEKLLTYALGRGLEYYDEHTVDQIVQALEIDGGKFQTLLLGVVQSAAFGRQRSTASTQPQQLSVNP